MDFPKTADQKKPDLRKSNNYPACQMMLEGRGDCFSIRNQFAFPSYRRCLPLAIPMISNRIELSPNPVVYVVDDDSFFLQFVESVLRDAGFTVHGFPTGESFLRCASHAAIGCVITDLRLPGIQGMEVHEELRRNGSCLSLIAITGDPDLRTAVQMVKHGAVAFLAKPVAVDELQEAVAEGIAESEKRHAERGQWNDFRKRFSQLSDNETKVLDLLIKGQPRKVICRLLNLSPRTVDRRRRHLLETMQVGSLEELISMIGQTNSVQQLSLFDRSKTSRTVDASESGANGFRPES